MQYLSRIGDLCYLRVTPSCCWAWGRHGQHTWGAGAAQRVDCCLCWVHITSQWPVEIFALVGEDLIRQRKTAYTSSYFLDLPVLAPVSSQLCQTVNRALLFHQGLCLGLYSWGGFWALDTIAISVPKALCTGLQWALQLTYNHCLLSCGLVSNSNIQWSTDLWKHC